jgi:hypothetical protein
MKKIYLILIVLITLSCKAQTPIIPIYDNGGIFGEQQNAYYKDVEGYFNQFVGTWLFTNGTKVLKVTFVKKERMLMENSYYVDFLVGEFQYIENGVEKANTLSNLIINYNNAFNYNLYSLVRIRKTSYPRCEECETDEKRLEMKFTEPANDDALLEAAFIMRRVIENGTEKLKVKFMMTSGACGLKPNSQEASTATIHSIPYGEYTLIKQ